MSRPRARHFLPLLARNPGFRRLWLAEVVSQLGAWLTFIAVSVLALHSDEGPLMVALVFVAHTLPHTVLAPVAGPLADRFDRRTVMIASELLRAGLTAALAAAALAEAMVLVQVLVFLRVAVGAFFDVASRAALPRLVARDDVEDANALSSLTWSVLYAAGMGLGGLLVAVLPIAAAIGVDALTFLVSAGLLLGLPRIEPQPEAPSRSTTKGTQGALALLRARPDLLAPVFGKAPIGIASGAGFVVLTLAAGEAGAGSVNAGAAALTLGGLQLLRGLGTGIGPLAPGDGGRLRPDGGPWEILGMAALAALGGVGAGAAAAVLVVLWGMATGRNWVATTAAVQVRAPDAMQGRLAGLDVVSYTLTASLGALGAAGIVAGGGSLALASSLAAALGLLGLLALRGVEQVGRGLAGRPTPARA